jgi:hypothetical protein
MGVKFTCYVIYKAFVELLVTKDVRLGENEISEKRDIY